MRSLLLPVLLLALFGIHSPVSAQELCRVTGSGALPSGSEATADLTLTGPVASLVTSGTWVHLTPPRPNPDCNPSLCPRQGCGSESSPDCSCSLTIRDRVVISPDFLLCRPNGSRLADFGGPATFNGIPGYMASVGLQDRDAPQIDTYTIVVFDPSNNIIINEADQLASGDFFADF